MRNLAAERTRGTPDPVEAAVSAAWERLRRQPVQRIARLTPRESEMMFWLAEGLASEAIAGEMGCCRRTIEAYRATAFRKLGARNAPHAAALFMRALLA